MSEVIDILTLANDVDCEAMAAAVRGAAAATGASEVFVARSESVGRFQGDLLLRMRFDGAPAEPVLPRAVVHRDGAIFCPVAHGGRSPKVGVYRTALFAAVRDPSPARLEQFEAETAAMPRRVATIRGWTLGRVTESWGRYPWTYVWEQTFDTPAGLTQTYMNHPCHWGQVDRWFDTEAPDWLIDPGLCHAWAQSAELPPL